MSKPTFVVMCSYSDHDEYEVSSFDKYKGNKSIFAPMARIYIDGDLEEWAGWDINDHVSGDILDVPVQEAVVIRADHQKREAQLVIYTASSGNKYAYLVESGEQSAQDTMKKLKYDYRFSEKYPGEYRTVEA